MTDNQQSTKYVLWPVSGPISGIEMVTVNPSPQVKAISHKIQLCYRELIADNNMVKLPKEVTLYLPITTIIPETFDLNWNMTNQQGFDKLVGRYATQDKLMLIVKLDLTATQDKTNAFFVANIRGYSR